MQTGFNEIEQQYSNKPDTYYDIARAEMIEFVPSDVSSVLEVGCSSGAFGALLKERIPGLEVWGFEPNPAVAAVAATRLDHVIQSTFDSGLAELKARSFDCIVFNDVLEHFVNPHAVLETCKAYMSGGASVVASIPNILHFYQILQILTEQDWRYEPSGIMDNTHLRFFTKKSIIRLFEQAGFEVECIRGINPSYGLKYTIANALLLGRLDDWKYIQFGVRAKLSDGS